MQGKFDVIFTPYIKWTVSEKLDFDDVIFYDVCSYNIEVSIETKCRWI